MTIPIRKCVMENVNREKPLEQKPVIYIDEEDRGFVCNVTNFRIIEGSILS